MTSRLNYSVMYIFIFPADTDGLITQALLTGNFEAAVDVCLHADRMVYDCCALLLAYVTTELGV